MAWKALTMFAVVERGLSRLVRETSVASADENRGEWPIMKHSLIVPFLADAVGERGDAGFLEFIANREELFPGGRGLEALLLEDVLIVVGRSG